MTCVHRRGSNPERPPLINVTSGKCLQVQALLQAALAKALAKVVDVTVDIAVGLAVATAGPERLLPEVVRRC